MTCEQSLTLISAELDGELRPEAHAALRAHLDACADCRRLHESLAGLDEKIAALREPAPEGLKRGILYRIDQATGKAKKPARRWFGPGTALGAVAAILVLLVGLGVFPNLGLPGRASDSGEKPGLDSSLMAVQAPETQAPAMAAPNEMEICEPAANGTWFEGLQFANEPADTAAAEDSAVPDNGFDKTARDREEIPADCRPPLTTGDAAVPLTKECAAVFAKLSAAREAAVLVYTDFDYDSLLTLLETEAPALAALLADSEPEAAEGMTLYKTDCGTILALQEWLLENLPRSLDMDAAVIEAEAGLRVRMEALDPGNGSLYKVITWSRADDAVTWPEEWPEGWADRVRTEENWGLFFPEEGYTPNAEKPAYLVFSQSVYGSNK